MRSTSVGPAVFASLLVFAGLTVGLVFAIRALNRRVARADAENAGTGAPGDGLTDPYRMPPAAAPRAGSPELAPLYYVLSIFFWPAGFVLGGYLLRDARTARVGRTCMLIAMGIVGVVGALTCIGTATGALLASRRHERSQAVRVASAPPYRAPYVPPTSYSPPPAPTDAVVVGRVGEGIYIGDLVVHVHAVERDVKLTSPFPSAAGTSGGARYVAFDVSFRNEGSRVVTIGSHSVKLFDVDGFVATTHFSGAKQPALTHASLTPGNVVRGWLTFKLPTDAKAGRLQILTTSGPSRVAEITLSP